MYTSNIMRRNHVKVPVLMHTYNNSISAHTTALWLDGENQSICELLNPMSSFMTKLLCTLNNPSSAGPFGPGVA